MIAASASYYFLVVLPAAQKQRNQLAAEEAHKKRVAECAEQARRAAHDMGNYSPFGVRSSVSGVSNHYNEKLGKCIADIETTDKGGLVEYVMDAYEQSNILWCSTRFAPSVKRICMDAHRKEIDPTEADKQIDTLMRE